MELVAKFYYDEKIFSNVALNCKHGSREIDTSFYGFKKSLFDKNLDYLILDPSELEWKENHSLEVFRFSRDSDKEVLKNILLTIVSSTEFPPYKVKCTDEKDYPLIENILSEKNTGKSLSKGFLEKILGCRFII